MATVTVAGHVCVDLRPGLPGPPRVDPGALLAIGPLSLSVGGVVGNCSRVLSALGDTVVAHGCIGSDDVGRICRSRLERLPGVRADLVETDAPTSYSVVIEPPGHDRAFWHCAGANELFDGRSVPVAEGSLTHLGYPSLLPRLTQSGGDALVHLLERIRTGGAACSLDLAAVPQDCVLSPSQWSRLFARALPLTDVFCPSWDDLAGALSATSRAFTPAAALDVALHALDAGAGIVLVSAGSHGFLVATGPKVRMQLLAERLGIDASAWADFRGWFTPKDARPVEKTLGAGDTLKAAFCHALVHGLPPADAASFANSVVSRHVHGERIAG